MNEISVSCENGALHVIVDYWLCKGQPENASHKRFS